MNLAHVEQIAKAVLYEGYLLYPYRPSSVKNRQRFNFGVVYPRAYSDAQDSSEPWRMKTECLIRGGTKTQLDVRLRFLQLHTRSSLSTGKQDSCAWQEAVEREVVYKFTLNDLTHQKISAGFRFPDAIGTGSPQSSRIGATDASLLHQEAIEGHLEAIAEAILDNVFKITVEIGNETPLTVSGITRDQALMHSLVSTHIVIGIEEGEFISLVEPPEEFQAVAAQCKNVGVWPVLVGEHGQRDTLLASPIILYDYPQIAPESVGDLFDGTEIDEILSLRIMTLTDEEKEEIRNTDQRAREILERTENMPAEQFMKLHGSVRSLRPLVLLSEKDDA